ncbi:MAG: twin-arginine translocase subunit TatC [Thermomicrobiales bacterium]
MARSLPRTAMRMIALKRPSIPRLPRIDEPYEDVFDEMTLQEHLEELRDRIVKVCVSIGLAFIAGAILSPRMLKIISDEANAKLDINSPIDPIILYMKMSLYIAVGIALPIILWHVIGFLVPGLTRKERRLLYTALPFVSMLFIGGASYAFFYAVPTALEFLSGFLSDVFSWDPDGDKTINFYLQLMIGLGFAFQLPVVMFLIAKLGLASAEQMGKYRKYAFVVILVLSAVITPTPDPINLAVVAIPLYLLYEVGLIIARIFAKTTTRGVVTA